MSKKVKKRILISVISVVALALAVVIFLTANLFWYYPHYRENKRIVNVTVSSTDTIRLMSYNLRCINPTDIGKNGWFYRADLIAADIQEQAPGVIGFQEATKWQYSYLVDVLVQYDSVITYRDDAFNSEGCPIFYNKELYTLKDKGSFWLSETPEVMSKSWGAQYCRVCSYVVLTDNSTGLDFVVFNTHLSHVSDEARINGIGVVLDKIEEFGSLPSVIMGDFNTSEGSETYNSVMENFVDAKHETEDTSDSCTYQGFGKEKEYKRIDYFMLSKGDFTVEKYFVLSGKRDGNYTSDHNSIVVDLKLK